MLIKKVQNYVSYPKYFLIILMRFNIKNTLTKNIFN